MNVIKMWRYTMKNSEEGEYCASCTPSPFSMADWRKFEAMGYVELIPAGDNTFDAAVTAKGLLLRRDRLARFFHAVGGFVAGIAATLLTQWLSGLILP